MTQRESDSADEKVADLARQVDCFTEREFTTLAGVKASTVHAWRKRGQGPDYILLGCNYLYPRVAVAAYLKTLIRERGRTGDAKGLL